MEQHEQAIVVSVSFDGLDYQLTFVTTWVEDSVVVLLRFYVLYFMMVKTDYFDDDVYVLC